MIILHGVPFIIVSDMDFVSLIVLEDASRSFRNQTLA